MPWHAEVRAFGEALCSRLGGAYALASEHAHSCCVLLAQTRFIGRTHIDYARFHDLVASGAPFTAATYTAPTPAWAVYGAAEEGFDPTEARWRRKAGGGGDGDGVAAITYTPSGSGCG